jgi:two-component system cell cycle sensor histidine kinase/response regulator CckA
VLTYNRQHYRHDLTVFANSGADNPLGSWANGKPEERFAIMAEDKTRATILVVDDKELVLTVVQSILKNEGFRVLVAISGAVALQLAADYPDEIDLLLSDIELTGMTGPQLGIKIKLSRPAMHVMLMSGLPGGDLLVLNYGWAFIQKPLVAAKLVEMIFAVLDSPDRSQGGYGYDTRNKKAKAPYLLA